MNDSIDLSSVVPITGMRGDSDADTALLRNMFEEAKSFIEGFDWCRGIRDAYFGCGIGGVVAVFYIRTIPRDKTIDECLWVIVGDIPPAYLVTDNSRTPSEAL